MFFSINELLGAWDNLSENVKSMTGSRPPEANNLDYSYITPTIIALGDFPDTMVEELVQLTQRDPVVIWNLGSKHLSQYCASTFDNQIIDGSWRSPCQYTRAPTLDCVFALCQSIKSWYDLNDRNLAVIHCPNGSPATGILIACLLKYIGAFNHAKDAYDFYCSKRLKNDPHHTLAPSYRILFENVDRTVDRGGYYNSRPMHLKTLTVAGLPVDEVPCVEVWDLSGVVFSSHVGLNHTNMCTWNADYGDGFFRVSQNIIGDFSIVCRFGGHLAATKDKTTLIFKYQNSTAFLPNEVVELKHYNVDINPLYVESLDTELFNVHIMFEHSDNIGHSQHNSAAGTGTGSGFTPSKTTPHKSKDGKLLCLPPFYGDGVDAFEAGLDEVSKHHPVIPASQESANLIDKQHAQLATARARAKVKASVAQNAGKGGSKAQNVSSTDVISPEEVDGEKYVAVALQLANNSEKYAAELIQLMKNRAALLISSKNGTGDTGRGGGGIDQQLEDGVADMTSAVRALFPGVDNSSASSRNRRASSGGAIANLSRNNNAKSVGISEFSDRFGGQQENRDDDDTWELVDPTEERSKCPICVDDNPALVDQILPCSTCHRPFHTHCVGIRKIPFGLKTEKEAATREKYVAKHFGDWRCAQCASFDDSVSGILSPSTKSKTAAAGASGGGRGSGYFGMGGENNNNHNNPSRTMEDLPPVPARSPTRQQGGFKGEVGGGSGIDGGTLGVGTGGGGGGAGDYGLTLAKKNSLKSVKSMSNMDMLPPPPPGVAAAGDALITAHSPSSSSSSAFSQLNHHAMSTPTSRQSYGAMTSGGGVIVTDQVRPMTTATGMPFDSPLVTINNNYHHYNNNMTGTAVPRTLSHIKATPHLPSVGSAEGSSSSGLPFHATPATSLSPADRAKHSKHDQIAMLMGLLATNGISVEALSSMPPEKQKDTLIAMVSKQQQVHQHNQQQQQLLLQQQQARQQRTPSSAVPSSSSKPYIQADARENGLDVSAPVSLPVPSAATTIATSTASAAAPSAPLAVTMGGNDQTVVGSSTAVAGGISGGGSQGRNNSSEEQTVPEHNLAAALKGMISSHPSHQPGGIGAGLKEFSQEGVAAAQHGHPQMLSSPHTAHHHAQTQPSSSNSSTAGTPTASSRSSGQGSGGAQGGGGGVAAARSNMLEFIKNKQLAKNGAGGVSASASTAAAGGGGSGVGGGPGGGENEGFGGAFGDGSGAGGGGGGGSYGPKLKDIPEYSKFFKMIKVGIPKASIAEKMQAEGLVGSAAEGMNILNLDPEQPVASVLMKVAAAAATGGGATTGTGAGAGGGGDAGVFSGSGSGSGSGGGAGGDGSYGNLAALAAGIAGSSAGSSSIGVICLNEHPKLMKYFKMLKAGLSVSAIKDKMKVDGIDEEDTGLLDRTPTDKIPADYFERKAEAEREAAEAKRAADLEKERAEKAAAAAEEEKAKKEKEREEEEQKKKEEEEEKKKKEAEGGGGGAGEMVPASEHPKYSKYFKMLKVGLPMPAVKAKMEQEGVTNTSILDKDPKELIPLKEAPPKGAGEGEEEEGPMVPAGEHPKYVKYFKMLKVGLPIPAVKAKMEQEGVKNTSILDKDPKELIPLNDEKKKKKKEKKKKANVEMVKACEHPKYSKYYKMMKVGLPKPAVQAKVTQEGLNPAVLDNEPDAMIPLDDSAGGAEEEEDSDDSDEEGQDEGPKVAASEHPLYGKFFKMLKVGMPKPMVIQKATQEGLDPSYLEKEPTDLIPLNPRKKKEKKAKGGAGAGGKVGGIFAAAAASKVMASKIPKVRKKKLHWKALNNVGENSLWADDEGDVEDIKMDEEEFNKLFVDSGQPEKDKEAEEKAKKAKPVAKQKVTLINMKRAQNAGIALARIKFSFEDLKTKIMNMDDENLTTDQLRSIEEYLPTREESGLLTAYKGDKDLLGKPEKFMIVMNGFTSAPKRIKCMIYKQMFKSRILESRAKISKIENACDDVKLSQRLVKVLKTVLKVGNQLNDGAEHKGFALESLLKLSSAKAFDKKTSILQYVIMLIHRNDPDILNFPDDLKNVSEASRTTMESITSEKKALKEEFDTNFQIVMDIQDNEPESQMGSMIDFLTKANSLCEDLDKRIQGIISKYSSVLAYFGEEPTMQANEFFSTLTKFIQEFKMCREAVERTRKQELKKQQAAQKAAAAAAAGPSAAKPPRRHSTMTTSSSVNLGTGSGENDASGAAGAGKTGSLAIPKKSFRFQAPGHAVSVSSSSGKDAIGSGSGAAVVEGGLDVSGLKKTTLPPTHPFNASRRNLFKTNSTSIAPEYHEHSNTNSSSNTATAESGLSIDVRVDGGGSSGNRGSVSDLIQNHSPMQSIHKSISDGSALSTAEHVASSDSLDGIMGISGSRSVSAKASGKGGAGAVFSTQRPHPALGHTLLEAPSISMASTSGASALFGSITTEEGQGEGEEATATTGASVVGVGTESQLFDTLSGVSAAVGEESAGEPGVDVRGREGSSSMEGGVGGEGGGGTGSSRDAIHAALKRHNSRRNSAYT